MVSFEIIGAVEDGRRAVQYYRVMDNQIPNLLTYVRMSGI
jgi:hypothetical protein